MAILAALSPGGRDAHPTDCWTLPRGLSLTVNTYNDAFVTKSVHAFGPCCMRCIKEPTFLKFQD